MYYEINGGVIMGLWGIILIVVLVMSATMIVFGLLFTKHAPKRVNLVYGYRSVMSMKNADTWQFGNLYAGKLLFGSGCIFLVGSLIALFSVMNSSVSVIRTVGIVIIIAHTVFLFGSIILTQKALHKTFDHNGKRKNQPASRP